ncbi:MAG: prepilin-type N-terminal cleavage/methylation domain-containing protein [Candidatus Hinthialibacter antarcticus]|nr:prepilin-type N-terminal cleavage/methylation domain-containing protein [Candidatus Hinthialibacter antarcticus]
MIMQLFGRSSHIVCQNRPNGGFTLVELMVVLAVIGVLSSIAVPRFSDMKLRSEMTASKAQMKAYGDAAQTFFMDRDHYPYSVSYDSKIDLRILEQGQYVSSTNAADPFQRLPEDETLETRRPSITSFFAGESDKRHGFVFVNYRNFVTDDIPTIRGIGLYSIGPDRADSLLSLYPLANESQLMIRRRLLTVFGQTAMTQAMTVYSPTNGLYSDGDFGSFRGEFEGFVPGETF